MATKTRDEDLHDLDEAVTRLEEMAKRLARIVDELDRRVPPPNQPKPQRPPLRRQQVEAVADRKAA